MIKEIMEIINELYFALKALQLAANQDVELSFFITDPNMAEAVDNMESYLGSAAHVVPVSADINEFLHAHPTDNDT